MIFLKFGSVLGDVQQSSHTNWIKLLSAAWGLARPVSNPAGSTAGRTLAAPRITELTVTKEQDVASIPLIQQGLEGAPRDATIDFVSTGGEDGLVYFSISLKQAVITGFSQSSAEARPVESVTFNFTQISFNGTQMDAGGDAASPSSYGWDVTANAPA